jgi:hypothetical protein
MIADDALLALRVLGLDYRPDLRQQDGLWEARCPCCAPFTDKLTLTISEGHRGGRVSVSCASRGCPAVEIQTRLRDALLPPVDGRLALELAEQASSIATRALELAEQRHADVPMSLAVAA